MKLFNQIAILQKIGHRRVPKFLDEFKHELASAGIVLPEPPDKGMHRAPEEEGRKYFGAVAEILHDEERLPAQLRNAVALLEEAASDSNRLNQSTQRRLPCISLPRDCDLDCALELWFSARDELDHLVLRNGNGNGSNRNGNGEPDNEQHSANGNGHAELALSISALSGGEGASDTQDEPAQAVPPEPLKESDEEVFRRLAAVPRAEYERIRLSEAKNLRMRVKSLDVEVAKRRVEIAEEAAARNVELPMLEPWPEAVDAARTLDEVSKRFAMYCVLPPGAADALALWAQMTHCFESFTHSPRLNLCSPESGCGKTTTLDVMACMTPRPVRTENLNAPTLFRIVAQYSPVLLLDEVDAYLNQAEDLRGLLNAGHKRGACAYRCEGEGNAVKAFKAFAPAVLAGIGRLPGTLHDRSIVIRLVKALPGEIAARFDSRHTEVETELGRKMARWGKDNAEALKTCDPKMPETAYNRLADNWRPLFAIAELAGGNWKERVLACFHHLTAAAEQDEKGTGVMLLRDIEKIFRSAAVEVLRSKDLVGLLCALPESPWLEANRNGGPITENWVAAKLREFGIGSQGFRMGEHVFRGYRKADFEEVFARYLNALDRVS